MGGRGASSNSLNNSTNLASEKEVYIKDWFFNKIKYEERNFYIPGGKFQILSETEKAYKVSMDMVSLDGEYETVKSRWIPKSATMSIKEYEAYEKQTEQRFEEGKNRYDKALSFAKSKGVKGVRKGMKKTTILKKIHDAGFEYEY